MTDARLEDCWGELRYQQRQCVSRINFTLDRRGLSHLDQHDKCKRHATAAGLLTSSPLSLARLREGWPPCLVRAGSLSGLEGLLFISERRGIFHRASSKLMGLDGPINCNGRRSIDWRFLLYILPWPRLVSTPISLPFSTNKTEVLNGNL